jgi:hypothetical protein
MKWLAEMTYENTIIRHFQCAKWKPQNTSGISVEDSIWNRMLSSSQGYCPKGSSDHYACILSMYFRGVYEQLRRPAPGGSDAHSSSSHYPQNCNSAMTSGELIKAHLSSSLCPPIAELSPSECKPSSSLPITKTRVSLAAPKAGSHPSSVP